ncbi:MAG TPA: RluA family pseudouridine synthase [Thermoanaerobaculia bacterium]|nr:RluA family pseudouridine synthase [Thermoanaerobaculia bacterium]
MSASGGAEPARRTFRIEPVDPGTGLIVRRPTGRAERADRLDLIVTRYLTKQFGNIPGLSRARVQEWIGAGRVRVDGVAVTRPSLRPPMGAEVEVLLPPHARAAPVAQDIPLSILYEDDWLLALDKPPGMVAHPTKGHADGTLLNALLWHFGRKEGGVGLVNRLDQGTSGVMLVAKAPEVHARFARLARLRRRDQDRAPRVEKEYLAVVYGAPPHPKGRIDRRILRDPADPRRRMTSRTEGRESSTLWECLAESAGERAGIALLRCQLLTGRTHQIRVHLESEGMPIVGDPLYGAPRWKGLDDSGLASACRDFRRQALHAWRLRFPHPVSGEMLAVEAPVPADLGALMAAAGIAPASMREPS